MTQPRERWFGSFEFDEGDTARWKLGPLVLFVGRRLGEWHAHYQECGDPMSPVAAVQLGVALEDPAEAGSRYIVGESSRRLHVQPLLPDRDVVTRPVNPVFVPSGEAVRFYMSVPLWLRLEEGEQRRPLLELPTHRPSDTWFGPSNIEGELCYALRSRCRLALDEEQFLAHRAIVPVLIRNHHAQALGLERIKVPVRQLGLYIETGGQFWTDELVLERSEDADFAALRVTPGAPPEAAGAEAVAAARDPLQRKTMIRAFSALFHGVAR